MRGLYAALRVLGRIDLINPTINQAAAEFKTSPEAVRDALRKRGVKPRQYRRKSAEQLLDTAVVAEAAAASNGTALHS
jgi:hypothetical protein